MTAPLAASSSGATWTPVLVRQRIVEAFEIERRIPDTDGKQSAWPVPVVHSFADVVGWPDASERIWDRWDHCGVSPHELTRWEQTITWLQALRDHPDEQAALTAWAVLRARRKPIAKMLRRRAWSRATFYRLVSSGSQRVTTYLNGSGVPVW